MIVLKLFVSFLFETRFKDWNGENPQSLWVVQSFFNRQFFVIKFDSLILQQIVTIPEIEISGRKNYIPLQFHSLAW